MVVVGLVGVWSRRSIARGRGILGGLCGCANALRRLDDTGLAGGARDLIFVFWRFFFWCGGAEEPRVLRGDGVGDFLVGKRSESVRT